MRKLVTCTGTSSNTVKIKVFRLRHGLTPEYIGEKFADGFDVATTASQNIAVSPDGMKVVAATGSSTQPNFVFSSVPPTESMLLPAFEYPVASFSSSINVVASSNTHFAVGGAGSILYVFDWETKTLQSAAITGLGTVRGLVFNEDGSKLAVIHQTAPYVRIYNTSDWTYINVSEGAGSNNTGAPAIFTSDGRLVVGSNGSPYLSVFDVATGERLLAVTSSAIASAVSWMQKHPDLNVIIWSSRDASASRNRLGYLDLDTYAVTHPFADPVGPVYDAFLDKVDRQIYLIHAIGNGRFCSRISLDDPLTILHPGDDLASLIQSSSINFAAFESSFGRITGTVRDLDNLPAEREVLVYHRDGRYLSGRSMSDPATGNFEVVVQNLDEHDVQFKIEDGEMLNDLFFARVEPEAV